MYPTLTFELIDRHLALLPDADAFAAKTGEKWIKYSAQEYNDYPSWFARHHKQPFRMELCMGIAMAGVINFPVYTSMIPLTGTIMAGHRITIKN